MRERKYRVWDKENKKFIVPEIYKRHLKLTLNGLIRFLLSSDYELMDYIGRKDKNKKEIYEGDILQLYYKEEKDGWPTVVEWDGFSYYPFIGGCGCCETYFDRVLTNKKYTVEVIGNKCENPELLKMKGSGKND